MGLLALLMVGNRRRHQYEYQHRCYGLQRRYKNRAEEADARRGFRQEQRQGDTGHQADGDLQHQAGAVEQLDKRVLGSGHDMHLYLAGRPAISSYCLRGLGRRGLDAWLRCAL